MRPVMLLLVITALSACKPTSEPTSAAAATAETPTARVTLNGEVAYRQRIALPPNAQLKVTISDVSLMDVASPVIAETTIETAGRQVPIPFTLDYDPSLIEPRGRYAVSARITDTSGKLLWITDTHFALPAPGTPANLMLVQVP